MADVHKTGSDVTQVQVPTTGVVEVSDQKTDFVIHANPADVSNYAREGDDLIIAMNNGDTVRIKGFFANGQDFNHLVFANGEQTLGTDFSAALISTGDGIDDPLVTYYDIGFDNSGLLPILAVVAGGALLMGAMDDGGVSLSAPAMSVADLSKTHHIDAWGITSANAAVTVMWPDGTSSTTTADGSGNWSVRSPQPEPSGNVTAVVTDAKGNHSPPTTIFYTDTTVPAAPGNVQVTDINGDHIPTASGTAAPGTTVTVHWADGTTSTVLVDSNGNWEVKANTPQNTGEVTAHVTDTFGATGPDVSYDYHDTPPAATVSITSYTDSVIPATGDFGSGTYTNDTHPQLNGTVAGAVGATDVVAILRDGVVIGTALINSSGKWTYLDSSLQDGHAYHYTAEVQNVVGNVGPLSADFAINVLTTPPPTTNIGQALDSVAPITGPITSGMYTNDPQPQLSGSGAKPNSVINLYDDNTLIGSTTTDSAGNWTIKPGTPLGEGAHDLTVTNVDAAGNESPSSGDLSFTVKTIAPTEGVVIATVIDNKDPVTGPVTSGGYTNETAPQVQGTITHALGTGEYLLVMRNGQALTGPGTSGQVTFDSTGTSWTFNDTGLQDGSNYIYTARVVDEAGNQGGVSNSYVVNILSSAPMQTVTITNVVDETGASVPSGRSTNDSTPNLQGSLSQSLDPNTQFLHVYRTDTTTGVSTDIGLAKVAGTSWTITDTTGVVNNHAYTYTAQVVNAAGLDGQLSNQYQIGILLTGPSTAVTITDILDKVDPVTGTIVNNGYTNDPHPTLDGTLTDATGNPTTLASGEMLVIMRGGVAIGSLTASDMSGSHWSYQDNSGALQNGQTYTYTAKVVDAASNAGTLSNQYSINMLLNGPSQTVTIDQIMDNTGDHTGPLANPDTTDEQTPVLSGTISTAIDSATQTVHVFRVDTNGAGVVGAVQDMGAASVNGTNWTYKDASLANLSSYTYYAEVVDKAGNTSAQSNNWTITINVGVPQGVSILHVTDNVTPVTGDIPNGGATNDPHPVVKGSVPAALNPGDTVHVLRDGQDIGVASMTGATTWTFTDANGLATNNQAYTYTAEVISSASNAGSPSNPWTVTFQNTGPSATAAISSYTDVVAPQTGTFGSSVPTNDPNPVLNGTVAGVLSTVATGDVVAVYRVDGSVDTRLGVATVDATGHTWTFNLSGLQDGQTYTYYAVVENAAGLPGTQSSHFSISELSTLPSAVSIGGAIDAVDPITGPITTGMSTNDPQPMLSGGGAQPNSTINIYDGNTLIGSTTTDGSGNWNYKPGTRLGEGTHDLAVTNVDAAGNESAKSGDLNFIVKTIAPTEGVTISTVIDNKDPLTGPVASGGYTNETAPQVQGTITHTLETGEYLLVMRNGQALPGQATFDSTGLNWSINDSGLQDGSNYIYTARVVDAAGNQGGVSNSYNINVLTSAPSQTVTITNIVDESGTSVTSGGSTNDSTPNLQGSLSQSLDPATQVLHVYRLDTTTGQSTDIGLAKVSGTSWTITDTSGTLNNHTYSYTAQVVNAAGLDGQLSNPYQIDILLIGPSTAVTIDDIQDKVDPITGPILNNGYTNDPHPTLDGTLTDASGNPTTLASGETLVIMRGGVQIATLTSSQVSGSHWSYQDNSGALQNGQAYTYTAKVVDAASNPGATSNAYTINMLLNGPTQTVTLSQIMDNTGDQTGPIPDKGTTDEQTPVLSGTISTAIDPTTQTLHVFRVDTNASGVASPAQDMGVASVNGTNWTYKDASLANLSSYTYYAEVVDKAGNTSAQSNNWTFTVNIFQPSGVSILHVTDNVTPVTGDIPSGGATNDPHPVLTGSVPAALNPGDAVHVLRDGQDIGTASMTSATTWSFSDANGLSTNNQAYTYTAEVVSSAGNAGNPSNPWTVTFQNTGPSATAAISNYTDVVAPQTGTFGSSVPTNDPNPVLNGTVTGVLSHVATGDVVAIYRVDGSVDTRLGVATVDATGHTWTFNLSGLQDGQTYTYYAVVENAAGLPGTQSAHFSISELSTSPSAVSIGTATDAVSPWLGDITTGMSTNDPQPVLAGGGAQPNSVINLYDGNTLIGSTTTDGSGSWSLKPGTRLGEGTHDLAVTNVDAAGNESAKSGDLNFIVKTIAPTEGVTISTVIDNKDPVTGPVASGGYTNETAPQVQGTVTHTLETGEYLLVMRNGQALPGQATFDSTGLNWSINDSGLQDGSNYIYTARVVDAASNQGGISNDYNINVLTSAPSQTVTITNIVDESGASVPSGRSTNDSTPNLQGSLSQSLDPATQVLHVYRLDTTTGQSTDIGLAKVSGTTWTITDTSGVVNNHTYNYTAQVVNAAGLDGQLSNQYQVQILTTGPTTTVTIDDIQDKVDPLQGTVVNNGYTNDPHPTLDGTLKDTSGSPTALTSDQMLVIMRDGVAIGSLTATQVSGSHWSYQDNSNALQNGKAYTYTAVVQDTASNKGLVSNQYSINMLLNGPSQTVTLSQIMDNTGDQTGPIPDKGTTDEQTPVLSGTISTAIDPTTQTLHVFRVDTNASGVASPAQDMGVASVNGTNWTYKDASLANLSSYTYYAEVVDKAGNTSAQSNNWTFTVNIFQPSGVSILHVTDNVTPVTGYIPSGGATNDPHPVLTGSVPAALNPGDAVHVLRDGQDIGVASMTGATTWTFTDANGLATNNQAYTYTAEVISSAGNAGNPSNPWTVTFQNTGPSATAAISNYTDVVAPQTGTFGSSVPTNDPNPVLNGTVTGVLSHVATGDVVAIYRVDGSVDTRLGAATVDSTGNNWTFNLSGLQDGQTYTYYAVVENAAGLPGTQSSHFSISELSTPPSAVSIGSATDAVDPITGPITDGMYTNDPQPVLAGSGAQPNSVINLYDGNKLIGSTTTDGSGNWSLKPDAKLGEGTHDLAVANVDGAGNESSHSGDLSFIVKTIAPTEGVVITTVMDRVTPLTGPVASGGYTNDTTPQVQGTITHALETGEYLLLMRNGQALTGAAAAGLTFDSAGTGWTYTDTGLQDGQNYIYTARVVDLAGNQGGISNDYNINVLTSAPPQTVAITNIVDESGASVPTNGSTNDSTPNLQGSLSQSLDPNTQFLHVYRTDTTTSVSTDIGLAKVSGTSWSITDTTGVVNNHTYVYTAQVVNAAGLDGQLSNQYQIGILLNGPDTTVQITDIEDKQPPVLGTIDNNGYTNDPQPTLHGTLSKALAAGESLVVLRDGTQIGTVSPSDISGANWTYQDTSNALQNGKAYTYTAVVVDAAANKGTLSNQYSINMLLNGPAQTVFLDQIMDNTGNATGPIPDKGTTDEQTPVLSGHLSAAIDPTTQTVHVFRVDTNASGVASPAQDMGVASVNGTNWTFKDASLANLSTYTYYAEVVDKAGNVSAQSNEWSFTVNTFPATTPQILHVVDNVTPVTGDIPNGGATNDPHPMLYGSVPSALNAGDVVEILRDGALIGTITATGSNWDSATTWHFTDPSGLTLNNQAYTYTAVVMTSAGNLSNPSNAWTITFQNVPPTATTAITAFTDDVPPVTGDNFTSGTTTDDTSPLLHGSITGTLSTVATGDVVAIYRADTTAGTAAVRLGKADVSGSTWSFQDSGLQDQHNYTYYAVVENAAGLPGTQSPDFLIDINTNPGASTGPVIVSYSDIVPPVTGDNFASGSATNDPNPTLHGTIHDPLGNGDTVVIYRTDTTNPGGAQVKLGTADVTGQSWTYQDSNLQDQHTYTYIARVENANGNDSPYSNNFVISELITQPTATTTIDKYFDNVGTATGLFNSGTSTDDPSPQLQGTITGTLSHISTGDVVVIYRDGGTGTTPVYLGTATVDSAGQHWTYQDDNLNDNSTYTYYAVVENAAGVDGTPSADFLILTDFNPGSSTGPVIVSYSDIVPPVTGDNFTSGTATNDPNPTLHGTIHDPLGSGDAVVIYRTDTTNPGGTQVKLGTADVTGQTWTYQDSNLQDQHTYTYLARVENANGNNSPDSNQFVISELITPPPATAAITAFTDDVLPITGDNFPSGTVTDDTSPLLHGTITGTLSTISSGDVVVIYRTDTTTPGGTAVKLGTADVDASGQTWTFQDGEGTLQPLQDQHNYTYYAVVENAAGVDGTPSANFVIDVNTTVVDSTAPVIVSFTDDVPPVTGDNFTSGTYTNDATPLLHGTIPNALNSGDSVVIYRTDDTTGGAAVRLGTADVTGQTWTYQDTGLQDQHSYTYTARVENLNGGTSNYSADFIINELQTPPAGTPTIVNYTDLVPPDTGNFNAGTTTDDRQPTLHGTFSGGALPTGDYLDIYNGTTLLGSTTVDSSGNWSLQLPSLNNNTTYDLTAAVVDRAGNEGAVSNHFSFTVQLNVTVVSQSTTDTTPLITGTTGFALQTGEVLDVTVNGKTYTSATGDVLIDTRNYTWALQIPDANALSAGTTANPDTYTVTASVMDAANQTIADGTGNLAVSAQQDVIYVPPPPSATNKATAMTIGETGNWRLFNNAVVMDSTATDSTNMATFSNNVLTGNNTNGYQGAVMATALFMDFNRDGYIDIFGEDSEYIGGQQAFANMGWQPNYVQTSINGSQSTATRNNTNEGYYAFQVGNGTAGNQTGSGVDFSGTGTTRVGGNANTYVYYSAVVAWDAYGTGWVGMVTGDANPNDSNATGGYDSAFIVNQNGIFAKDPDIANARTGSGVDATGAGSMSLQGLPYKEVSAVDIDNNGTIDVVYHMARATAYISTPSNPSGASTTDNGSLVVVTNNQAATGALSVPQIVTNVFYYSNGATGGNLQQNGISMTWADFNGDGWLDLYVGSTAGGTNGTPQASGKIFFNNGAGLLSGTPVSGTAGTQGIMTPGPDTLTLPGNFMAGGSLAVDWNCDGKMDIVAVPFYPNGYGSPGAGTPTSDQQVMLFTNTTASGSAASFTSSILKTIPIIPTTVSQTSASNPNSGTAISGILSMDINWDGAKDMVILMGTGVQDSSGQLSGAVVQLNPNTPAYGTSLHFRILDKNGINSFFGNTVQLVDDQTGKVVSTQVINPQGGVQTEDSSAIVDFYGLDASHTYSLVLLASVNGVSQDVGGVHSVGTNTIENYNAAWGGIAPTDADHAYVLTAASDSAVNDTYNPTASGPTINTGNVTSNPGTGLNMTGIVGTGYNDTFFATQGHNLYEGGGGTTVVSGVSVWSNTGGQDMVDYKLAGSTAVTVDLSRSVEQNTGFGYATFHNIEGIAGGSGNDTFTDALTGNNIFNGRGGNDTFNLTHGGHDTLLYQVITSNDGTGGNGSDTVNGWFVGLYEATPQADRIDLSALLQGYTPSGLDGNAARYINGVATINAGDNIGQYLSVTHSGNDTVLNIDRDGAGGQFQSTTLVTLKNTDVDLATLLANHQIVV